MHGRLTWDFDFQGAVDIVIASITTLFYVLAAYPRVRKLVQTEIDRVVGRDRLPTLDDRPSMPYSEAVYRELVCWALSDGLEVPHCTSENDIYKGYFILKSKDMGLKMVFSPVTSSDMKQGARTVVISNIL